MTTVFLLVGMLCVILFFIFVVMGFAAGGMQTLKGRKRFFTAIGLFIAFFLIVGIALDKF